jgi:hypothetical protein
MTGEPDEGDVWRMLDAVERAQHHRTEQPLELPGGREWNPPHLHGPVHIVDGDGASLCQLVAAEDLVAIGPTAWSATGGARRCPSCQLLLDVYRG